MIFKSPFAPALMSRIRRKIRQKFTRYSGQAQHLTVNVQYGKNGAQVGNFALYIHVSFVVVRSPASSLLVLAMPLNLISIAVDKSSAWEAMRCRLGKR